MNKSNKAKFCICRILSVVVPLRREGQGGEVHDVFYKKSLYKTHIYTCQGCAAGTQRTQKVWECRCTWLPSAEPGCALAGGSSLPFWLGTLQLLMSSTHCALIPELLGRAATSSPAETWPEMHPRGVTNVPQPLTSTQPSGPDSREPHRCMNWDFGGSAPSWDLLLWVPPIF